MTEGRTMTTTVTGVWKHGRLSLVTLPVGLREGRVQVVLIEDDRAIVRPQPITFGMFSGGPDVGPEQFAEAEFHGEAEFDDTYA
jgi:hypothetical protein